MAVVVERSSLLDASAERVWQHATSMAGVNRELAPVVMTHPTDRVDLTEDVPLGVPLFTSTLRYGPLPFDRHRLTLVELNPGVSFQEDSTSILHRQWRHRRVVTAVTEDTCRLTDRVEVTPRLPGTSGITRRTVERVFDRRHAVLRHLFGTAAARA